MNIQDNSDYTCSWDHTVWWSRVQTTWTNEGVAQNLKWSQYLLLNNNYVFRKSVYIGRRGGGLYTWFVQCTLPLWSISKQAWKSFSELWSHKITYKNRTPKKISKSDFRDMKSFRVRTKKELLFYCHLDPLVSRIDLDAGPWTPIQTFSFRRHILDIWGFQKLML